MSLGRTYRDVAVAIKKVQIDRSREQEREVVISVILHHPNVVNTYGVYRQDNCYFFVMERADVSLKTYLEAKEKELKYHHRKEIIYQIACGLNYTAEQCICHHDLKVSTIVCLLYSLKTS